MKSFMFNHLPNEVESFFLKRINHILMFICISAVPNILLLYVIIFNNLTLDCQTIGFS